MDYKDFTTGPQLDGLRSVENGKHYVTTLTWCQEVPEAASQTPDPDHVMHLVPAIYIHE